MAGSKKIREEGSVNMNKILAIAFATFIVLLIASAFVYAWPDKQTDCSKCHGPSLGTYEITVTATPNKTILEPGETYTVEIFIGENPSGEIYGTGYWIANSDAEGTTRDSTGVYGGSSSGNKVTDQTYTVTMTAPSTPGTYYYKVFGVDGPANDLGATGWALYSITVTAPDTEPPTVTITYPEDGATLNTGTFTATWTATDNVGVVNNKVYLNDVYQGETAGSSWDFFGLVDGSYSLRIESYDAAGNMGSDTNSFTVSTADTEPPTVTITYPEEGAVLDTGTFTATWTATDNVGVEYSEVYLNGVYQGQTVGYSWDFTDLPNGDYSLMIKSFDAAGNWGSDTHLFSVSVPPPPMVSAELAGVGRKPGSILPGNNLTLKARVKNTGTVDVVFYVEFVIKNPTGDVVGMVNTTEAVEFVGDGPLWVSTSWLVPPDASAGTYTVEATLYYKAVGTPTYITGNTLTLTFKVRNP